MIDRKNIIKQEIRQICIGQKHFLEEEMGLICHYVGVGAVSEILVNDFHRLPDGFTMTRLRFLDCPGYLFIQTPKPLEQLLTDFLNDNPRFPMFAIIAFVSYKPSKYPIILPIILNMFDYDEETFNSIEGSIYKFPFSREVEFEYPIGKEIFKWLI